MADLSDLSLGSDLVGVEQPEARAGNSHGESSDDVGARQPPVDVFGFTDDVSGCWIVWLGGVVRLRPVVHDSPRFLTLLAGVPPLS